MTSRNAHEHKPPQQRNGVIRVPARQHETYAQSHERQQLEQHGIPFELLTPWGQALLMLHRGQIYRDPPAICRARLIELQAAAEAHHYQYGSAPV